jgi:hypothetical protein
VAKKHTHKAAHKKASSKQHAAPKKVASAGK